MEVSGYLHAPPALPPGRNPGRHCIGGWVGPRAGLDGFGKREKSLFPVDVRTPDHLACSYTGYDVPAVRLLSDKNIIVG